MKSINVFSTRHMYIATPVSINLSPNINYKFTFYDIDNQHTNLRPICI